jgi:hypothetical protein
MGWSVRPGLYLPLGSVGMDAHPNGQTQVSVTHFRPRSAMLISRLKNTVGWFVVREKYCFSWKNKLKSTDYKPDEQDLSVNFGAIHVQGVEQDLGQGESRCTRDMTTHHRLYIFARTSFDELWGTRCKCCGVWTQGCKLISPSFFSSHYVYFIHNTKPTYLLLPTFQIIRRFGFSIYIFFAKHLNIQHVWINVSRKIKMFYNLE